MRRMPWAFALLLPPAILLALPALHCGRGPRPSGAPAAAAAAPSGDGAPEGAGFSAGAATSVITPDPNNPAKPVIMGGPERGTKATRVHDDLYARALVMTDGSGTTVGLVVLDLIGFFHDDVEAIREELSRRHPKIKMDYLAVASTHTHAGPDVIGLWTPLGGSVDADYVAHVRSQAVDAVVEAWRARRPARLQVAQSLAPGLARDTRLPDLVDDNVMVMGLTDAASGKGIASLVNWNSHPGVSGGENTQISADFPRAVVALMEKEWGGTCLYASGDLGGQIGSARVKLPDPLTGGPPADRMRRAELIGGAVGDIALKALRAAGEPEADPRLTVRTRPLFVPLDNDRFAQGLSIGLIRPRRLYQLDGSGPGWLPSELPDPASLRPGRYSLRTEVAVVDAGLARWVLIPGELYPELAFGKIQEPQDPGADFQGAPKEPPLRPASDRPLFLIGLANDELGYLIPKSQWDSDPPYAYGRSEPQYGEKNSTGPETAPILMRALQELLAGR